jgi:hypothetical protein
MALRLRWACPGALCPRGGDWLNRSAKVLAACRHRIRFSITLRQTKTVATAITAIGEGAWTDIDYPDGGTAQVAETTLGKPRRPGCRREATEL